MRIVKYSVVKAELFPQLEHELGLLLEEGWQPYGELHIVKGDGIAYDRFFQVVVKYSNE